MNIQRSTYFLITGTDQPGEASNLLSTLQQHKIDLEALWGYGTSGGRSEIYVVPKNPTQFKSIASKIGINCQEGTCFRWQTPDELGALTSTLSTVARKEINLTAVNGTVVNGQAAGYLWTKPNDAGTTAKALGL